MIGPPPTWLNWYQLAFDLPGHNIWAAVSNQHDIPFETQLDRVPGAGTILRSTNDGATWDPFDTTGLPLPLGPVVSILYQNSTLYASVWGAGVYSRLFPGPAGTTWGPVVPSGLPTGASLFAYRLRFGPDQMGTQRLHVVTAADRRCTPTICAGGLYRKDGPDLSPSWSKLTARLDTLLCPDPNHCSILAPTEYAFDPSVQGKIYLCSNSVQGSNLGGGCYQFLPPDSPNSWRNLNVPAPPEYWWLMSAFAPYVFGGTLFATTLTHGIWKYHADTSTWSEYTEIPFLAATRLTADGAQWYITTNGGGAWKAPGG